MDIGCHTWHFFRHLETPIDPDVLPPVHRHVQQLQPPPPVGVVPPTPRGGGGGGGGAEQQQQQHRQWMLQQHFPGACNKK